MFELSDENYEMAWECLGSAYEVKRLISRKHLEGIFELPCIKEASRKSITRLIHTIRQHVRALESLKEPIGDHVLVYHMEKKLPKDIADKWEKTLNADSSPTFNQMCEFLTATAIRLAKRESNDSENQVQSVQGQHANKKAKVENKKQAFMIHASNNCPICKNVQHPLYRCPQFKEFPVSRRIQVVRDANLCMNCMRYHPGECRFTTCRHCNQPHNSMLHIFKANQSGQFQASPPPPTTQNNSQTQ